MFLKGLSLWTFYYTHQQINAFPLASCYVFAIHEIAVALIVVIPVPTCMRFKKTAR